MGVVKLAVKHPRKGHIRITCDVPGADCLVSCDFVDQGWWIYDVKTMTDAQITALTGKPASAWRPTPDGDSSK